MLDKLVSIITPCYNGEAFIGRYLDSVLNQTYSNIELIIINDGSTDKTAQIIESYRTKFEEKSISFLYLEQENAGQSAAINKGLKLFQGEYLTWPDSDDILHHDYIEKKVNYMETHKEIDLVISPVRLVSEDDLTKVIGIYKRKKPKSNQKDSLFLDLIDEKNVYFPPGGYMVRSATFIERVPTRHIYDKWAGQNYQLLLPIAYHGNCGYLDEILYDYVVRQDSHSKSAKSLVEIVENTHKHKLLLDAIITGMGINEEVELLKRIRTKYSRVRLKLAYQFRDKQVSNESCEELKELGELMIRDRILAIRTKYRVFDLMYLCVWFVPKKVISAVT